MTSCLEMADETSDEIVYCKSLNIWLSKEGSSDCFLELSPLDIHTECSIGHYECIRNIIKRKDVSLDMKNKGGWTPLMYACYTGHESVVNLLLEAGVSVNSMNNKQATPLMLAASCGNEEIARCLLEQQASSDVIDHKGWTALYHATFSGHQNVVKTLLLMGANANISEPKNGMTPLMEAASAGHEAIVQLFLQQGVDFRAINKHGHSALMMAMLRGHTQIVSMIKEHSRCLENMIKDRHVEQNFNPKKNSQSSVITEGPEVIQELMKKKLTFQGGQSIRTSHSPRSMNPQTTSAHSGNHISSHTATTQHCSYNQQGVLLSHSNLYSPGVQPSMNLHQLLVELGLAKYSPIFEEQDVDLAVFLTLTDHDLKEIGVNLLGPRKKMMMAINRWHNNTPNGPGYQPRSSPLPSDRDFQEIVLSLHQGNQHLQQQLQREEQLRSTLESCLTRDRLELHEFVDRLFQHFNRFSVKKDVLIANLVECIKELECTILKQGIGTSPGQSESPYPVQSVAKLRRCCVDIEALLNSICNDTHSLIVNAQMGK